MSTTSKYGFNFLIPLALLDTPIAFTRFHKGVDELGDSLGHYTYNEYTALGGNKAFYTPNGTHAILSINITSTKLRQQLEALLSTTPFVIYDGDDIANWEDVDQSLYLWILSTEPSATTYNYKTFIQTSPLFVGVVDEVVVP